jgi:hypothetical protein
MAALRNKQDLIALDNSFPFRDWLQVLARPTVFASLSRMPSREHLLSLLDAYQPFAQSLAGDERLALELLERMRVLLSGWSPPDLPAEIVDVARALLRADGSCAVLDWDKGPDLGPGETVDNAVVWPPWEPRTMSDDIKWPPFEVKGGPLPSDNVAAIHATPWLMVLASPQVYRGLGRTPTREHLLHMLDLYITYVGHDGRYNQPMFQPVPYERRAPLAAKLRALLEAWMPPELPSEITAAARELLYAEGLNLKWDNLTTRTIDPDFLRWPEGIPALLKDQDE